MAAEWRMSPQMEHIHGEIRDNFRAIANGFQRIDKIKDPNRQSRQLEELTGKMSACKGLIKEFDQEIKDEEARNPPEVNRQLNDEKQSMKNQELIDSGKKTMDETDQVIERSKKVVEQTIEVGTQTAVTLKGQTEKMGRIVNDLDTIQFSIKKASQLVKEIGRQVATDKCIMLFLFLIVCGVIAIIIVKIVNPHNKDIGDIPDLAPPTPTKRLLYLTERAGDME